MVLHFGMGFGVVFLPPRPSTKCQENKIKSNEGLKGCEISVKVNNKSLNCVYCRFYVRTKRRFKKHQRPHLKKRLRCSLCKSIHHMKVCKKCKLTFSSIGKLVEHTLIMHRFSCNLCPQTFQNKRTLIRHRYNHNVQEVVCPICSKKFFSRYDLSVHVDKHVKRLSVFKCQVCQEIKPNSKILSNHIMLHHVDVCLGGDNPSILLPASRRINEFGDITDVSEQINNKSSPSVEHMRNCSITLEKLELNYCPICPRGFLEVTSLKLHIFIDHVKSLQTTQCEICGKSESCAKDLTCHIMSHINPGKTHDVTVQIGPYSKLNRKLPRSNRLEESKTNNNESSDLADLNTDITDTNGTNIIDISGTNVTDISGREVVCDDIKINENTSSDNSDGDCKENIIRHNLDGDCKENVFSNDSENSYKVVLLEDTDYSEEEAFMCPCSELFETMEDLRNHSLIHI
uniref:C2H2-type domain-containing protein n=1 Tax=Cuerna arida TaxID=1464854 RepID=A0A1B6H3G3_9HEMI